MEQSWSRLSARRLLFGVLAIVFLSSLLQRYAGNVFQAPDIDFYVYYFAGQMVHHNPSADVYEGGTAEGPQPRSAPVDSELFQRAHAAGFSDVELYLYPPLLADLLAPVSRLSPPRAALLWRFLNLGFLVAVALAVARLVRVRIVSSEFAVVAIATVFIWPVHESLSLGQVSVVMLLLWAVALVGYAEGAVVVSAAALAIATALKVTPIVVVPVFLIWKDRRWLVSYFATLSGLICYMGFFNGWHRLAEYTQVVHAMGSITPVLQNKSIASLMGWIAFGRIYQVGSNHVVPPAPSAQLLLLTRVASLLFYSACLVAVWRRRNECVGRSRIVVIALFSLIACLLSPISWRHGYTVALLPFALLWSVALSIPAERFRPGFRIVSLTAASIAVGSLVFDLATRAPLPVFLKILCAGMWVLSCAALCLEVLWRGETAFAFSALSRPMEMRDRPHARHASMVSS